MPHIRSDETVSTALLLSDLGLLDRENAAISGVTIRTVRRWRRLYQRRGQSRGGTGRICPPCEHTVLDEPAYARLLGYYLGDGHIVQGRKGVFSLSVISDLAWPGVLDDIEATMRRVAPTHGVCRVPRPGCVAVKAYSKHWPCLFPQHGPGRKHHRPIRLEPWQQEIVDRHPGEFMRGLFHSDGCRSMNLIRRQSGDEVKTYAYPRYFFVNHSQDILALCGSTLDSLGIAWRYSKPTTISVAQRAAVAALDTFVGPKF